MNKRVRRLAGVAWLSLALGCGDSGSPNSVSSNDDIYGTRVTNVEDARRRLKQEVNDPRLEQRIDETLNGFYASAKVKADVDMETLDFGENNGDFNLSHRIDLDDFFLFARNFGLREGEEDYDSKYDLNNDGRVELGDFFIFGSNFGKMVNQRPGLQEVLGPSSVVQGEEAVFTANAVDSESDEVLYHWSINGGEPEINGGELRVNGLEPGNYEIGVTAVDEFEGVSDEVRRSFTVESSGPVLSFDDRFEFDQWDKDANGGEGAPEGNKFYVDLDKYSDREVTWKDSVITDNAFEHTKENTAPFGVWLDEPYRARSLRLTLDGDNVLEIDPMLNYNRNDHGIEIIRFTATDSEGRSTSQDVEVYVTRTPEFDGELGYDDVVTGERGWGFPIEKFCVYNGRGISREGERLEDGVGPYPTDEEIGHIKVLAGMIPEVSDYFGNFDVENDIIDIKTWDEWLDNRENAVLGYIADHEWGGGTYYSFNKPFEWAKIGINSISKPNPIFLATGIHELFCHGMGFYHPKNDSATLKYVTIFSGVSELKRVPKKDMAIIDSFLEGVQYNVFLE